MTRASGFRLRSSGLVFAFLLALPAGPARAQEPSESHLKAALETLSVLSATDGYDAILPAAAQALKTELINKDPNLQDIIIATVDETALTLASRRKDLELESARIYAKAFTEDELKAITEFYKGPIGSKFQKEAPIVVRGVAQAAQVWQNGIARDLAMEVGKKLTAIAGTAAPAPDQPADGQAAEGEKPAGDAPKP
jgi:hypothetical protein